MLLSALILASAVQDVMIRRPFLSPIFSDHMVLQRGRPNSFWGWTDPGKRVRVAIENEGSEAISGPDGKWIVKVNPPKVGGPYQIKVTGPQSLTLSDVLVGDVWLCGGQSNMQFGVMGSLNGKEEIAASNHPQIRFTIVPTSMSFHPRDFVASPWKVCSPETIGNDEWNGLSAVGYYFGRELQKNLNIPIGLVHDCRGGSSGESWMSRPTLETQGGFSDALAKIDEATKTDHAEYAKNVEAWILNLDPGSKEDAWAQPDLNDSAWQSASLPASYGDLGFGWQQGVTWFRTEVDLPAQIPGAAATISLGAISDMDWTFVNGKRVGSTHEYAKNRNYEVPSSLLHPGKNQISVRVLNVGVSDGFMSPANAMTLKLGDGQIISLAGPHWRVNRGPNLWSGKGDFPYGLEGGMGTPTVHFNSMILPVAPLAVRGAIWYQGESNVGRSRQYIDVIQHVASDWRAAFQTQDLPFYQVQLANFESRAALPGDSVWAALREAQMTSSKLIPKGGLVTASDIGEAADIHPRNKQEVGLRLAKLALNQVYGQRQIVASGPAYRSFRVDGSQMIIQFSAAHGGLVFKGAELKSFSLAGADRKFYWASGKIVGNTVVLSCPEVSNPVAARYGWADNPELTLYNGAGLPAFPFRTDDWPVN